MSRPAKTRLGDYEILGPLGAGGMGEVYRARDARLEREVALAQVRHVRLGATRRRYDTSLGAARPVGALPQHNREPLPLLPPNSW